MEGFFNHFSENTSCRTIIMIINDVNKFIFIHIPKCAGSTIRTKLQRFDQTGGRFTSRVDHHSELGIIDYVHIPLFILRLYFPSEYNKTKSYTSFAIIRDPFLRFPSALSQHLKEYENAPIQSMSPADIKKEVDKAIEVLRDHMDEQSYLPYKYIHFQRQVDFIFDGQEPLVRQVYQVFEIPKMLAEIANQLNIGLEEVEIKRGLRTNQSIVYRNALIRVMTETTKPLLKSIFGPDARKKLRAWFYVSRDKKYSDIFGSSYVRDFIQDYYASDIRLIAAMNRGDPMTVTGGV